MINTIAQLISVICVLIIISLVIWQVLKKHNYSKAIIVVLTFLFLLTLYNVISPNKIDALITLLTLITLLLVIAKKKSTPQQPNINNNLVSLAKEQERSRIYANLHDDVGAKLLELIYSAENDKTKELAKQVLSNIRQAVATTVNIQCTCEQLIKEIIEESTLRLNSCGIQLTQNVQAQKHKNTLKANIPNSISRIIREVINNIIKHAQTTHVIFNCQSNTEQLEISIVDNGTGFSSKNKKGKGIKTIKKRAYSINAEVEWSSDKTSGTTFKLSYHYDL